MESMRADCRNIRQQCTMNNPKIDGSLWLASENSIKLVRKQARMILEENSQPSSQTIHVNNTDPLDIDEASLDLIVDERVRFILVNHQ